MAPHTPGVLRFGKLSKPVAPAGYKNKQCRKQTSVLSGRTVTAYVPLRSATERKRAAFLIPCQGLRDYFTNFQFTVIIERKNYIIYSMIITQIPFRYYPFSFAKYSFVSFTTTPDSRNTAIRLGMTMSPLKVSAMLHISPRFIVAPTIAVREYRTMKGMLEREPKRNSIHLVPYSP